MNRNASAFTDLSSASLERRDTTIYEVIDLNAGQPVYVGKTFQQGFGEEGIQTRLDQHESLKPEWKGADYEIREIKSGTCTNFETATREMRAMMARGGPLKVNPASVLQNIIRSITSKNFQKYVHLHSSHDPAPFKRED